MITTQKSLPCLQEMVANYLTEARLRFVLEEVVVDHNAGCHRFEKDRGMKVLQAEERKRREGRECVSPACRCLSSLTTFTLTTLSLTTFTLTTLSVTSPQL